MQALISSPTDESISGSARQSPDMQDRWLNFIRRHVYYYNLAPETGRGTGFQVNARSRSVEAFTLARFNTMNGRSQLVRGSREVGLDERERYVLYMPLRGQLEFSQLGRSDTVGPSSMTLMSASEPTTHTKLGDNDTLIFLMPREFIDKRVLHIEDMLARPVTGNEGIRRLLLDTLLAFQRDSAAMDDEQFHGSANVIGELALLAFSGASAENSDVRTVRSCNLARAKRVIRRRLENPDLTLTDVARECGLSLRYLHDLFRDDGRTAREYLIGERLQHARQMLERSGGRATTVTEACMASGFSNPSHFSTAFRRAFGSSPRDILQRK